MVALALMGWTNEAAACGGFGCDLTVPVLQNAEQVVFSIDGQEIEMHVQISYEGEANEFAWIVPVPADPELFVTTAALFSQLQLGTAPIFTLTNVDEGRCDDGGGSLFGNSDMAFASGPEAGTFTSTSGGVNVIATENVGPYETVTLQATSVDALMTWLDDNNYAIPDGSEASITPYIAPEGAYFVALRLQKGKDTGDLQPLGLRYPASKAIIPVQLTAVSAVPDMRMQVYLFGAARAVPESYLHVQINEAAVDWWNFGQNYFDVITEAANQASGHAFATDYYGPSDVAGSFFFASDWDEAALRTASNPVQWFSLALNAMAVVPPEAVQVAQDQLGLSEEQALTFVQCPSCVDGAQFVNGPGAATDDLVERVIEPLQEAQELVDTHPRLSRLTSSLDAFEMTVDPIFVLNPDMVDEVSNLHTAQQVFECGNGKRRENSNRRLVLANGIEIEIPSQSWFDENGLTEIEYIASLGEDKALIIEETGASGQPTVLVDHTAELVALVADFNSLLGCGCNGTGAAGGSLAGLVGVAAFAARRRRSA
jgi:MYXO-CTERM domain-containing protein